jgi:hypothetical protein
LKWPREKRDFGRDGIKSVPQGLKARSFAGFLYGLKPVPTRMLRRHGVVHE